jgi:hypothetical protein
MDRLQRGNRRSGLGGHYAGTGMASEFEDDYSERMPYTGRDRSWITFPTKEDDWDKMSGEVRIIKKAVRFDG